MLNHYPAESGVHRPNRTGNNGACSISSNSSSNSNADKWPKSDLFYFKRFFYLLMNVLII